MSSEGLARGVELAAVSGLPEGVGLMGADEGLDDGVALDSMGAEVAPAGDFEPLGMGQFSVHLQRYVCQLRHLERPP